MTTDAVKVALEVYTQVKAFYVAKSPALARSARGFRILYGPPTEGAPLLFLGDQPGGNHTAVPEQHEGWPAASEYATECWPLACRIREVWTAPDIARSTGLNVNFFRSPSQSEWAREVARPLRREIEKECRDHAARIVAAISPKSIVTIGLRTFNRFGEGAAVVNRRGRILVKRGELWGIPAHAVIHLSGAWLSTEDREEIRRYFADQKNSN